jgi:tetratricopeptide (TPR) repeat protein
LPVFDQSSRVESIFGDWRIPKKTGLYDRSEYLFQVGFGFLQGDVVSSAVTEGRTELASLETALQRAKAARAALEESTRLAPGNAYTWGFLGWAYAMEGNVEGAVSALEVSWSFAPYSAQLAPSRLNLLEALIDINENILSLPNMRDGAVKDLGILQKFDKRYLEISLEDAPLLRGLAASSGVREGF